MRNKQSCHFSACCLSIIALTGDTTYKLIDLFLGPCLEKAKRDLVVEVRLVLGQGDRGGQSGRQQTYLTGAGEFKTSAESSIKLRKEKSQESSCDQSVMSRSLTDQARVENKVSDSHQRVTEVSNRMNSSLTRQSVFERDRQLLVRPSLGSQIHRSVEWLESGSKLVSRLKVQQFY